MSVCLGFAILYAGLRKDDVHGQGGLPKSALVVKVHYIGEEDSTSAELLGAQKLAGAHWLVCPV